MSWTILRFTILLFVKHETFNCTCAIVLNALLREHLFLIPFAFVPTHKTANILWDFIMTQKTYSPKRDIHGEYYAEAQTLLSWAHGPSWAHVFSDCF